jgi:serine/threonine-protein kinase
MMGKESPLLGAAVPVVAGKYRLLSSIGRGGMGEVFVAEDLRSRHTVAIKVLSGQTLSPKDVRRFVREARVMVRLRSEHVARVFDIGKLNSEQPFIVMEHLRGQDFGRLLQRCGRFAVEDAVASIIQASRALAEAHAMGIVHRDLKPSNLFLTHGLDGRCVVKVLDFGISMLPEELDERLTASADVFGTPEYMSPEQARSAKQVDARTDIWSLGLILAEFISGIPVCKGAMQRAMLAHDAGDAMPNLHLEGTGTPPEVEAVIRRCLQKNPSDRYQNVAELVEALRPFAGSGAPFAALSVGRIGDEASRHPDAVTRDAVTQDASTLVKGAGENRPRRAFHLSRGLKWLLVVALAALDVTLTTPFARTDTSSSSAPAKAPQAVAAAGTKSVPRFANRARSLRSPSGDQRAE